MLWRLTTRVLIGQLPCRRSKVELGVCEAGKRVRLAGAMRSLFAPERRRARRRVCPTSGIMVVATCCRAIDPTKDGWNVRVYAQRHRYARGLCISGRRSPVYYRATMQWSPVTFRIRPVRVVSGVSESVQIRTAQIDMKG